MKASIVTIGDEILIGQIIDTNTAWMAQELYLSGIDVIEKISVGDTEDSIFNVLENYKDKVDIVLVTGGLGPTRDDKTKEVVCKFFDTSLVFHEATYRQIEQFFLWKNKPVNEANRLQAFLPASCIVLPNKEGTAPGMWLEKDNTVYVFMPGVPYEMKSIMLNEVLIRLKNRFSLSVLQKRTILTEGIGESDLAEIIEKWEDNLPENMGLAYLPSPGRVRLRLYYKGNDVKYANDILEEKIAELLPLIEDYFWGFDEAKLEEEIGILLLKNNKTLSVAESCTGGNISHLITLISGCSDYYNGSVTSYSNEVKINVLGVDKNILEEKGAVSKEVVEMMAEGVKKLLKTDYSIATSGVAGPTGGTELKPVGLIWIAISGPNGNTSKAYNIGKNRERNITIASYKALNMLRKQILKDNLL
jgi:nicotinamide-nucleotide amidase